MEDDISEHDYDTVQKQNLIDILRDSSEDTEMRVTAYVQIMTCPTRAVLTDMQAIMESESEDSQVKR